MIKIKVSKEKFIKDCKKCAKLVYGQYTNDEFAHTQKCIAIRLWHHLAPTVLSAWDINILEPLLTDEDMKNANNFNIPITLSPHYENNIYTKNIYTKELMLVSIFIKKKKEEDIDVNKLCGKIREIALKWGDEAKDILEAFDLTTSKDVANYIKNSDMFIFEENDLKHNNTNIL